LKLWVMCLVNEDEEEEQKKAQSENGAEHVHATNERAQHAANAKDDEAREDDESRSTSTHHQRQAR